jgi:cobyrinic acid a,c-diamide synthase
MTPRVVIAAPASGSGKTTVATGLMAALRERGLNVAPGKVGPDYIDPGYHTLAAGRPGRNLDPVLVGRQRIAPLFAHGARDADIAIVEGVMGLYDGKVDTDGEGSTAHVAELLKAPVLLVVDARGQGRSLAALLHGFRSYAPEIQLAGVILNNVGSPRHADVLRKAAEEVGLPVVGVLPRDSEIAVPSRHLGLITAAENGAEAVDVVAKMAELVNAHVDLDAVLGIAAQAPPMDVTPWDPRQEVGEDVSRAAPAIAIAAGTAFTFGYAEHSELLTAAGARVVTVDPLRDKELPEGTCGVVLPGGFPELHTEALTANGELRERIAEFARAGGPVHAECAGLLYLARTLEHADMCGVLDASATFGSRLVLGYREAVALADSVLFGEGERVVGHEFHRTVTTPPHGHTPAWAFTDSGTREGFVDGRVHASYLHTHPAAVPTAIARFVRHCAEFAAETMVDLTVDNAQGGNVR